MEVNFKLVYVILKVIESGIVRILVNKCLSNKVKLLIKNKNNNGPNIDPAKHHM